MKTPMTNTYNLDNHVTVMIGNEEFNGYIVKTASKGIAQNQKVQCEQEVIRMFDLDFKGKKHLTTV